MMDILLLVVAGVRIALLVLLVRVEQVVEVVVLILVSILMPFNNRP
tara:strand:+ start:255 stop:392 length:138 start_codon:yes stop_codon:yes gene_type:complete